MAVWAAEEAGCRLTIQSSELGYPWEIILQFILFLEVDSQLRRYIPGMLVAELLFVRRVSVT
jgi:hypothetical protein